MDFPNYYKDDLSELSTFFYKGKKDLSSKAYQAFHEKLYAMGLIFNFNWMRWYDGYDFLNDSKSDYSQLPLLKVSMYLTSIFRSVIFTSGTIKQYFENRVINKLMSRFACLMHMGSSSLQQY